MTRLNTYVAVGAAFMIAGIAAIASDNPTLFAAWFPIGAAFIVIGSQKKPHK